MSLSLQTLVLLPPKGGYHLVARQGGLVEPRNSELECSILRALERMVDTEGEQSPSFFFFFFLMRVDGGSFSSRNLSFSS